MTRLKNQSLLVFLSLLLAMGCAVVPIDPPDEDIPVVDGDGASSFISHVAGQSSESDDLAGGADAGAAAPDSEDSGRGEAERAISEADIIQLDGDRLFALSRYSGLTVIDLSDPNDLSVLGRYRTSATPFEMYLVDDVAYIMFNGFYRYEVDDAGIGSWRTTARMVALDVTNPGAITELGDYDVPGDVSDSRMVGDVLYLVTYQNGWCWRCDDTASTHISSFDASDPSSFLPIDELAFDESENSWGPRSISVTQERMYVAGPNWSSDGRSAIQVVDIADPNGSIELGAEVEIAGSIDNRWQMDEHEGVLRVISQVGGWNTGSPPVVETFSIESTNDIRPLASLEMVLPRPEDLRSVRFDGDHAYAITFERVDPLFTLDLSDPAAPRQVGELEIPGWVYHMEPRGDRIYALGYDDAAEGRGMTVSIFDVSDMSTPTMLDRVVFGGSWAWAVEDQDRIHKAFNLLLDRGLILVPFAGVDSDPETCEWRGQSGIQIIEVEGDDLRLRGVAPQIGTARRSILRGDTLFGVSDNAIQAFDITDRNAPLALDRVEVARNISSVHVLGDTVLRFGNDWWTQRTVLDIADAEFAGDTEGMGELDLSELLADERGCDATHRWGSSIYVHGDYAYVPRYSHEWNYDGERSTSRSQIHFYVIDLTDRAAPRLLRRFPVDAINSTYGDDGYDYEQYADILVTDSALLVGRRRGNYGYRSDDDTRRVEYSYDVFDLEDSARPTFTTRFSMPDDLAGGGWGYGYYGCGMDMGWGWWYAGYGSTSAMVSGDIVASNHGESVGDDTGRVRYYLDRLDVSNPREPRMLSEVNIPGQLARYDHERGLVVTLEDDLRTFEGEDWEDCGAYGRRVRFERDEDTGAGTCRVWDRVLNTLEIRGDRAVRLSRAMLDTSDRVSQSVAVSGERIFVGSTESGRIDWDRPAALSRELQTFAIASNGQLQILPDTALPPTGGYWWPQLAARGTRAFLTQSNALVVIDATDKTAISLTEHEMPGWYCQSLQVEGDRAYCAMGQQGVMAFEL